MSLKMPRTDNIELTIVERQSQQLSPGMIQDAVDRAGRRLAPLWSLRNFVAVNPYLGLTDDTFEAAAQVLGRRAGARMTAPRDVYAQAIREGRITDDDLDAAIHNSASLPGAPQDVESLKEFALGDYPAQSFETVPTVADIAAQVTDTDWAEQAVESISRWAGSYFDQGQAYWQSPWRDLSPYAAWRAEAEHDRTPEVRGLRGFRQIVKSFPESADETIREAVNMLGIPADGLDAYLHRLYLTIHGWASYGRYQLWEAELRDNDDATLTDLLAIRLVWEVALLQSLENTTLLDEWQAAKTDLSRDVLDGDVQTTLGGDLLLQRAFEQAYQRDLFDRLASASPAQQSAERPQVQAAFCIDVRSEIIRRALEGVADGAETLGFAGFFGVPIEYVPLGEKHGGAQCPALIAPQFKIHETIRDASDDEVDAIREKRTMKQRVSKAWRLFKFGMASCFGFVGPVGLAYVKNLITNTLGWERPVPSPKTYGVDAELQDRLAPRIEHEEHTGHTSGMTLNQRIDTAAGMLTAMSLTDNFARLVLLVGHGSTTVNNPYASGLDCGACGGHSGDANARIAAEILNDARVREALQERGIDIPEDTVFAAGLHDTTTDTVKILDKQTIPASHADDVATLEDQFAAAGRIARAERAPSLKVQHAKNVDKAVMRRSTDWSQVRPEWGLAGCSAFIVAPREQTRNVDLGGKSFLHNYDWQQDEDFAVLESIMTAPMVVTSWINLQYFASAVDNEVFGSGNKVLHNVVGTLGILEGNGGDLRVGLPWQSVHDGDKFIHEPLRLTVMINAPTDAITDIIAKHDSVRELVNNGWMHLFALDDDGNVAHRYAGNLEWTSV